MKCEKYPDLSEILRPKIMSKLTVSRHDYSRCQKKWQENISSIPAFLFVPFTAASTPPAAEYRVPPYARRPQPSPRTSVCTPPAAESAYLRIHAAVAESAYHHMRAARGRVRVLPYARRPRLDPRTSVSTPPAAESAYIRIHAARGRVRVPRHPRRPRPGPRTAVCTASPKKGSPAIWPETLREAAPLHFITFILLPRPS